MNFLSIGLVVTTSVMLISCGGGGSSTPATPTPTPTTTAPTIGTADKNTVAPCPNQSILTDATELAALKDALATGTLVFLDVPYEAVDPDNIKKKCGLEGFWDPVNNTNEVPFTAIAAPPVTLSTLITNGFAGICVTDPVPTDLKSGFPAAGTYRTEIKAAKGGSTWHLRMRSVASGGSAGNTFTAEGIAVPAAIEGTVEYKVNGQVTAHADLLGAMAGAAATSGNAIVMEASKTTGGASVFSMSTELICVTKS